MILSYTPVRVGPTTTITVTTDLVGVVWFHWFIDGAYQGVTTSPVKTFGIATGDQARVEVLDTQDPGFDPVAHAPAGYPARRSLVWIRSIDDDVAHYRVEQQKDGGDWETLAIVHHDSARWTYPLLTPRLEDLADYAWRIIPVDAAGNDGDAVELGTERVVRTPDAPDFAIAFSEVTDRVTFSVA